MLWKPSWRKWIKCASKYVYQQDFQLLLELFCIFVEGMDKDPFFPENWRKYSSDYTCKSSQLLSLISTVECWKKQIQLKILWRHNNRVNTLEQSSKSKHSWYHVHKRFSIAIDLLANTYKYTCNVRVSQIGSVFLNQHIIFFFFFIKYAPEFLQTHDDIRCSIILYLHIENVG